MKHKRVLILGSGPSAAYSALACLDSKVHFDVLSNREPHTEQSGAFFLHWLPDTFIRKYKIETIQVKIYGIGSSENYSRMQWGIPYPNSFPLADRLEEWYDSRTLKKVWKTIDVHLLDCNLKDQDLLNFGDVYDLVLHSFSSEAAKQTRSIVPIPCWTKETIGNGYEITYNGGTDFSWVRCTHAWKRLSLEFPPNYDLPGNPEWWTVRLRDIRPDTKPVSKQEYLAPHIIPIGRFATWDRRMLCHQAYQRTLEHLN